MTQSSAIDQLVYLFSKLPGLGTRSARRIILHLLQDKDIRLKNLIDGLTSAADNIKICNDCSNLDYNDLCNICNNEKRSNKQIAIVETVADLWAIERSDIFKGKYHVLGQNLSINNRDENKLNLPKLRNRCKQHETEEIIIATNTTLDGQTTAYFITEYLSDLNIKVTRLASGMPMGGELDYLDEGTVSAAIKKRQEF